MADYLSFIGPSTSLAAELVSLQGRLGVTAIVNPVTADIRGTNRKSIQRTLSDLMRKIHTAEDFTASSRLSIWAYEPNDENVTNLLWEVIGRSAWLELIPNTLLNKDRQTRFYIEERYKKIRQCLHEISYEVYNRRNRSPFILPLRNFGSKFLDGLRGGWYANQDVNNFKSEMTRIGARFRGAHRRERSGFVDDGKLLFAAAANEACHGMPHPVGSSEACFLMGRYRFGVAIFPGFHYDVSCGQSNLRCTLYDCDGVARNLTPERRKYINVFPNDHLLPETK